MSKDKKKELRTNLSAFEFAFMLAMPLSQITGYVLVLGPLLLPSSDFPPFPSVLLGFSIFHTLWAIKNRVLDNPGEAGFLAFGTTVAGFGIGFDTKYGQLLAVGWCRCCNHCIRRHRGDARARVADHEASLRGEEDGAVGTHHARIFRLIAHLLATCPRPIVGAAASVRHRQ